MEAETNGIEDQILKGELEGEEQRMRTKIQYRQTCEHCVMSSGPRPVYQFEDGFLLGFRHKSRGDPAAIVEMSDGHIELLPLDGNTRYEIRSVKENSNGPKVPVPKTLKQSLKEAGYDRAR